MKNVAKPIFFISNAHFFASFRYICKCRIEKKLKSTPALNLYGGQIRPRGSLYHAKYTIFSKQVNE